MLALNSSGLNFPHLLSFRVLAKSSVAQISGCRGSANVSLLCLVSHSLSTAIGVFFFYQLLLVSLARLPFGLRDGRIKIKLFTGKYRQKRLGEFKKEWSYLAFPGVPLCRRLAPCRFTLFLRFSCL